MLLSQPAHPTPLGATARRHPSLENSPTRLRRAREHFEAMEGPYSAPMYHPAYQYASLPGVSERAQYYTTTTTTTSMPSSSRRRQAGADPRHHSSSHNFSSHPRSPNASSTNHAHHAHHHSRHSRSNSSSSHHPAPTPTEQPSQAHSAAAQALRRAAGSRYDELVSRRRSPSAASPVSAAATTAAAAVSSSPSSSPSSSSSTTTTTTTTTTTALTAAARDPFRSQSPLPVPVAAVPLPPSTVTAAATLADNTTVPSPPLSPTKLAGAAAAANKARWQSDETAIFPLNGLRGLPCGGDITFEVDPRARDDEYVLRVRRAASSSRNKDLVVPRGVLAHRTVSGTNLLGADGSVCGGKGKKVRFLGVEGLCD